MSDVDHDAEIRTPACRLRRGRFWAVLFAQRPMRTCAQENSRDTENGRSAKPNRCHFPHILHGFTPGGASENPITRLALDVHAMHPPLCMAPYCSTK
jgi:hypothetical protein